MPRASALLTVLAALLSAGCVLAPAPAPVEPTVEPTTPVEGPTSPTAEPDPTPTTTTPPPAAGGSDPAPGSGTGSPGGATTGSGTSSGGAGTTPAPSTGASRPPPPPIGGYAPDDDDDGAGVARPIRFSAGADAGPDRLSATVPAYAIGEEGASLEAQVVAVREARVVVDSLLRVENVGSAARAGTLEATVENTTGVEVATLELWDPLTDAVVHTLDLLGVSPRVDVTLAAGARLEGRYTIGVGGEGGEGFRVAFTLAGTS